MLLYSRSLSLNCKKAVLVPGQLFFYLTPGPSPTSSALWAPSPYLIRPLGTFSLKKEKGIGFLAYLEKGI
jgi:hypothetical protein